MTTIFTESGKKQGYGHLSRCCALYDESISRGYDTRLIVNTTEPLPDMSRNIIAANWLDSSVLMPLLADTERAIIDSYLADATVYRTIAAHVSVAVYIDDCMRIDYPKGLVVNPSLYGDKLPYPQKDGVTYVGGEKYVIVRPEFQDLPPPARTGKRNHILLTMGGSDVRNLTPVILARLTEAFPAAHKHVVVGAGFENQNEIHAAADKHTTLYHALTALQMRQLMQRADVAVTAAGQTIYELMSCGVPMIPIKVIENQQWNIEGLRGKGFRCLDAMTDDVGNVCWQEWLDTCMEYQPLSFFGQRCILQLMR